MTGVAAWKIALAYLMFFEFTLLGKVLINVMKSNCKVKKRGLVHYDVVLSRCPMPMSTIVKAKGNRSQPCPSDILADSRIDDEARKLGAPSEAEDIVSDTTRRMSAV
ncbi:hypothetical protein [Paraburkholderia oxyphila]|uniref:hypothetical protein n=1 Tax=Paraburkholderia oxyphila TaxID=614212 RepID=UPI0005BADFA6|nr:hypothetical protein [Paraburkholderia oxyphila]